MPSPSHSLCVLLSLCRIIDRLQLEALSEIIIIRLNALAATVLQSCFLSITHALSQPVSLSPLLLSRSLDSAFIDGAFNRFIAHCFSA